MSLQQLIQLPVISISRTSL